MLFACQNRQNNNAVSKTLETKENSFFVWHWEAEFTKPEQDKIQKYISTVAAASFKVLGNYPFTIHFYIERSDSKNEPIPWAHTERSKNIQAVRFHINPDFDYDMFFADWTAPHEISHLSIPYLGKENAWFAEGYASYMQYQIMQEMGVYTKAEVKNKYLDKKQLIKNAYNDDLAFVKNANLLKKRYNFPALYWGGAQYFIKINELLAKQQTSLVNEIKQYQTCCRLKDNDMSSLLNSLDSNLETAVFKPMLDTCKTLSFQEVFLAK